jgi:simple sugar transport system ATP-binding protein
VPGRSVGDNATLAIADRLGCAGFVRPARQRAATLRLIAALGIATRGPDQPVSRLSGGNQQKVVLARALAADPAVLVLINPTAGVDVKSRESLLASIERERQRGKAVLLVSSEIDDLGICDRVLVMLRGQVVGEYGAGRLDAVLIAAMEGP